MLLAVLEGRDGGRGLLCVCGRGGCVSVSGGVWDVVFFIFNGGGEGVYRIGVVPQMKVMPGIHQNARLLRVTGLV